MKVLEELGYYAVHYQLNPVAQKSLIELKERLLGETVRHTGWPPFWFPTAGDIAPKAIDQSTYECVHDGSGRTGHLERWRASTLGEFRIIRRHDLDEKYPGQFISLTLPVWRIAEIMLHAGRMGVFFQSRTANFTVQITGLAGRELSTKELSNRILWDGHKAKAAEYRQSIVLRIDDIDRQVAQYTDKLLRGFYHLFDLELPSSFCDEEVTRMRSHRF